MRIALAQLEWPTDPDGANAAAVGDHCIHGKYVWLFGCMPQYDTGVGRGRGKTLPFQLFEIALSLAIVLGLLN